jgi:hypothetical protein
MAAVIPTREELVLAMETAEVLARDVDLSKWPSGTRAPTAQDAEPSEWPGGAGLRAAQQ